MPLEQRASATAPSRAADLENRAADLARTQFPSLWDTARRETLAASLQALLEEVWQEQQAKIDQLHFQLRRYVGPGVLDDHK